MESATEAICKKISDLTPEQLAKVDEVIATLQTETHAHAMRSLSEAAFADVWSDPLNDAYDSL